MGLIATIAAIARVAMLLIVSATADAATAPQPPDPLLASQQANAVALGPISGVPVISPFPTTGGTDPVSALARPVWPGQRC